MQHWSSAAQVGVLRATPYTAIEGLGVPGGGEGGGVYNDLMTQSSAAQVGMLRATPYTAIEG